MLEYGCSVGTLTLALAEHVGESGYIYATDHSKRALKIAKKRIAKRGHIHVQFLYDNEHTARIHPDIPKVDAIVSVGMIGYVQKMEHVLMNQKLDVGGKVCFLDYDNFFSIIPNVDWLAKDDYIHDLFLRTGFKVEITRKEGLFWQYIFIYGEKIDAVTEKGFHFDKNIEEVEEEVEHTITDSSAIPTSGEIIHPRE